MSSASLERHFSDLSEVFVSYALRIDALPGRGAPQVMNVAVTVPASNGDFFAVFVFVKPQDITLVEQTFPGGNGAAGGFTIHPLTAAPIVPGTWQRVDLILKLSPPKRLKMVVGGVTAYEGTPDPFFRPGNVSVSAGVHYADAPSGPLSARVDDLYVIAK